MCFPIRNYYYCSVGLYYMNDFLVKCDTLDIKVVYTSEEEVIIYTYPSLARLMKQHCYMEKMKDPFHWNLDYEMNSDILWE